MNVYLTNNQNNNSNDGLEEAYPEFYLVYFCVFSFLILATVSTIMCIFPIQCALGLTILLVIGKLLIKRTHMTFFENEYDLDIYPENLYQRHF
jgi:anaerobic C4-dicarboxylate transporter